MLVLVHYYFIACPMRAKPPVANASKAFTDAQRKCIQIQKKAFSIVFALQKFPPVFVWASIYFDYRAEIVSGRFNLIERRRL